jgi:energy-coupling factor transporter ATP-binding protein EcfA2
MALEEKIVEWSVGKPDWQRMVLRRVADGEPLSEVDYDTLVDDLVAGRPVAAIDFKLEHVPHSQPGGPQVQLVSVSNLKNVNALASETPLTFSQKGLTVVYGDNAAGKSGYARVLKSVTRARHQEDVLSDVFRDTGVLKPEAELEATVKGVSKPVKWAEAQPHTDPPLPEAAGMLFYDAPTGQLYIDTEFGFPYRPPGLFVMDGLVKACLAVRDRIDKRLVENQGRRKLLLSVADGLTGTEAGKFIGNLSGSSTEKELDALIARCDSDRIENLKKLEAKLRTADVSKERQRLMRDVTKLDSLADHLETLGKSLGVEALKSLVQKRKDAEALGKAAELAAKAFDNEPLPGVGSEPWKVLWEAARDYSEKHAYVESEFPVTKTDSRCVLCQQQLVDEVKERLKRFQDFVQNDTQTKLRAARTALAGAESALEGLACVPQAVVGNLKDLTTDHTSLMGALEQLLKDFEVTRTATLEAVRASADIAMREVTVADVAGKLRDAANVARETARSLEKPADLEVRLARLVTEREELELLEAIKKQSAEIVREIVRLKERATLESVKSGASTTGITKTITELSEDNITEVVRDRFTRESQELMLQRITMTQTRAVKGAVLHQSTLVGAKQSVGVRRVFSEGEKTALGLAAFFTEVELDGSKSALVFDDPVSSLDHIRRRRVAARLASFAETRQVIVFSHDAEFVRALKQEALVRSVVFTERQVCKARLGEEKPGKCLDKHPWNLRDVSDRLKELETDLQEMRRERRGWNEDTYLLHLRDWAGRLSQVWERILIQEVRDRVFAEGELEVRPKMLKVLAKFSDKDDAEFQGSYWRISSWITRHEQESSEVPELSDLESELSLVRDWWKRIKSYQ